MAKLELKKQKYQNTSSPTIGGKKAAAREHETNQRSAGITATTTQQMLIFMANLMQNDNTKAFRYLCFVFIDFGDPSLIQADKNLHKFSKMTLN